MSEAGGTESRVFLSVVMCTHNRAASLERALTSISNMNIPEGLRWEMVLVDNASTDHTADVVKKFTNAIPIRRVLESKPGLSNARNAGVAAATGDYILWTDDDVEVDAGWIAGYATAIARFPDGAVFGGRIIPRLEAPSPKWFTDNLDLLAGVLANRDLSEDYFRLSEEDMPWGANYAIRAAEQRLHLYDPELGVAPGSRRVGEEVAVMKAILAEGGIGYWVPHAKVFHIISKSRQTEQYVRSYYIGQGETATFVAMEKTRRVKRHRAIFHHALGLTANFLLFHFRRRTSSARRWIPKLMGIGYHYGALNYALKHRPVPRVRSIAEV